MARATPSTRLNLEVECVCSRREYPLVNVLLAAVMMSRAGRVALGHERCGDVAERFLGKILLLLLSLFVVIIGEVCGLNC